MLRLRLDDSKSGDDITVVAGILAPEHIWDGFELSWALALHAAKAKQFHANKFFSCEGEFKWLKGRPDKHRELSKRFCDAAATGMIAVGRGLDMSAFNDVVVPQAFMKEGTPNNRFTPLMMCLRTCLEWIAVRQQIPRAVAHEEIAVLMEGGKGCGEAIQYCNYLKDRGVPWIQRYITIGTGDKRTHALQAADLWAHQAKHHFEQFSGMKRKGRLPPWERLLEKAGGYDMKFGKREGFSNEIPILRDAIAAGSKDAITNFRGTHKRSQRKRKSDD